MPLISQVQKSETGTRIWTKGLEWDLGRNRLGLDEESNAYLNLFSVSDGTPSAIGGFLSTSNHLKENQVHVKTEGEIIWTMEIRKD